MTSILLAAALPSCKKKDPSSAQTATLSEERYRYDYREYESTQILDGNHGPLVLVRGVVRAPDGSPSPLTLVTLDQTFPGEPSRCLVTRTDGAGNYVVRGDMHSDSTNMIWAATPDGKLGCSWVASKTDSPKPVTIDLHGGATVLHVRNANCDPIAGASVSVYKSGIDDISGIVPPNIRKVVTKTTDNSGVVRFPSRLSDGDLGFDVHAAGHRPLARDGYYGLRSDLVNMFMIDMDENAGKRCAEVILNELYPNRDARPQVNLGRPDQL